MKPYVGNLNYEVNDRELRDTFAEYGGVESAQVICDRETGKSKGFGFVEMISNDDAEKAVAALNESELRGRKMLVQQARPKSSGGDRGRRDRYRDNDRRW